MSFIFRPRAGEDACQITSWHYPPTYDFYDLDQDPEDLAEFLNHATWKGLGLTFINAGLAFGQEHFSARMWSLRVATFNIRAVRLYTHAGFTPLSTFLQHTNGGEYDFLRMVRPALE